MTSNPHKIPVAPPAPGAACLAELKGVCKTYTSVLGRPVPALADVTLELRGGEVVGVAGPNGAGKSTLLSILTGFLTPSSGTALVGGLPPGRYAERSGVACLPELVRLPPDWTVTAALTRLGALGALAGPARALRVAAALEELGLESQASARVGKLSKGNLQRLGIAQVLLSDSDLMVFDEPSNGLDPVWLMRFRDLVRRLRRPGRLIVVASHNLDELERLTDRVVILGRGRVERVVEHSSPAADGAPRVFRLKLLAPCAALAGVFPGAAPVEGRDNEYRLELDAAALSGGLLHLLQAGAVVLALQPEQSGLERAFSASVENTR